MKRALALLLAAILALLCAACGEMPVPMSGEIVDAAQLRIGLEAEPASLDPALCTDPMEATLLHHLYEGLTAVQEDGSVIGAAAESWKATTTKDAAKRTVYTFTLREDACWSDGTPVKAEDFIYAWTRIITGETECPCRYLFDVIHNASCYHAAEDVAEEEAEEAEKPELGLEAKDERTLVVTLEGECAAFPRMVSAPAFYPQREDKVQCCNGAYALAEWVHDDHLTLAKNENYRAAAEVSGLTLEFVIRDADTLRALAEQNELQASFGVTLNAAELTGSSGTDFYYFFNTEKVTDVKVRAALLALTEESTAEISGMDGSADAEAAVDEKKALLAEVETLPEQLTLLVCGAEESAAAVQAQAYADLWQEGLGLPVTVKALPYDEFCAARETGEYDLIRCAVTADYEDPAVLLGFFQSEAAGNWALYSQEDYDELMKKSRSETDDAERLALLGEAKAFLEEDVVLIPLRSGVTVMACSPQLSDVRCNALGVWDFTHAEYQMREAAATE